MLSFEDEVVEFEYKGEKHQVEIPNNGQIKSYNKKLTKCETDEQKEEALIDFLKELGLKQEVYNKLNPRQMGRLLEKLYSDEKN